MTEKWFKQIIFLLLLGIVAYHLVDRLNTMQLYFVFFCLGIMRVINYHNTIKKEKHDKQFKN